MADTEDTPGHVAEPKNFEPKTPVTLNPPKDDPITLEELSKCDGGSSQFSGGGPTRQLIFLYNLEVELEAGGYS
jgi:hypothetical protein